MAPSASKQRPEPGSFHLIAGTVEIQTLIIAVAGVGTPSLDAWTDASAPRGSARLWLKCIPAPAAPAPALYGYSHGISPGALSWPALLEQGATFMDALVELVGSLNLWSCPILLVSHSIGGLIVKEALRRCYEDGRRSFLRVLAGVIFLGTPHSSQHDETRWQKAGMTMPGLSRRKRTLTPDDVATLATSSRLFEEAAVEVPILSVHETRETKVKTGLITSTRTLLMDAAFVKTGCRSEEIMGVDSDHNSLCNLRVTADYYQRICTFIKLALEGARFKIIQGSPEFDVPSDRDDWTTVGLDTGNKSKHMDATVHKGAAGTKDHIDRAGASTPTTQSHSQSHSQTVYATAGSSDLGFDLIPQSNAMIFEPVVTVFPVFMVSVPRNRDFFGREGVLSAIDEAFFSSADEEVSSYGSAEARTFAICGPGGMGKTQVAAEFAHTRKHRFDAVFWIRADFSLKLRDEFTRVAIALGLVEEDSTDARDPAITGDLVKGWLANPVKIISSDDEVESNGRANWLLVFDNVDDTEVLEDFWPVDGPGCVLFTSRDSLAKNSAYLASTGVDLQPLGVEEASVFLDKLTRKQGDSSGVYSRLGGFPLAITQMASIIIRRDLSYAEFIECYDEVSRHAELFQERYDRHHKSSDKETIWSVWALDSLRHSKPLLDVISMLDPDGVWEDTLRNPPDGLPLLKSYPRTAVEYQKARTELLQSSLVSRDSTVTRLVVHRLIQDTARAKMSPARFRDAFASALRLVSSAWPFERLAWRHAVSRWKRCEELFPHVVSLRRLGASIKHEDRGDVELILLFCKLLTDAGWYYHERGYSSGSKEFFLTAQMCESLRPELESSAAPDAPGLLCQLDAILAELHHNLGCIGTETNDPASTLRHFKIFNKMMIAQTGSRINGKDRRLAISWNELGNAYMMNKMWRDGERCFRNSIKSSRLHREFRPTDTSFPYVNLGLAYWFMGRYDDAMEHLLLGLRHREDAHGVDDNHSFITGRFLHALGNVRESQGMLGESLTYHRRALRQYESTIGKNHHRTGDVHVRIADHLLRDRHLEEARHHMMEALRIFGDSPAFRNEKARALFKLSKILVALEDLEGSEKARRESTQLHRELYPDGGKAPGELGDEDFDDGVAFWSR